MSRAQSARVLLAVMLVAGLALRVMTVFTDEGIFWPDEIYQSFEPAHWVVFGYGLKPWEFIEGARNWTLPALLAVVFKVCALLGGDSPRVYVRVAKLLFAAASVVGGWGVYRLVVAYGKRFGEVPELAAAAAGGFYALCGPVLYFSARAMSENAATVAVVWGLALVVDADSSRRRLMLGASLVGLAVLFRLQAAIFALGAVPLSAGWPRGKAASRGRLVLGTLAGWALLFGLTDAWAWHDAPNARALGLFHSAVVYLRFNLLEGKAAQFGVAPWHFYFDVLWRSMPAVVVSVGALTVLSLRRAWGLFLTSAAFLVVHVLSPHKEYRFVLPVFPLLFASAGIGLGWLPRRQLRWGAALLAALAVYSAWASRSLTMGDLGAYPERAQASAWDDFGNVNRLLLVASERADICGLRIDVAHLAWTGGSTYLHRKAPIYSAGYPVQLGHFNYALTFPGSGGEVIARERGVELVRLPGMTGCTPDPQFPWLLP